MQEGHLDMIRGRVSLTALALSLMFAGAAFAQNAPEKKTLVVNGRTLAGAVVQIDGRMVERMHADIAQRTVAVADAIEAHFAAALKPLPLNVDGAVAAVLCELGVPTAIANGFFIIPRVVGLIAHFHEERTREKVMRRFNSADAVYDGPAARELPARSEL